MTIPKEVKSVVGKLKEKGYEAFIVGGCLRDFLRGREPGDWDVATKAKPEEIQKVFPDSFYENKFLTVTVKTGSKKENLKEIEITTYRSEARYTDKRHPDEINFAKTIKEDLSRRDFTVNAMAMDPEKKELIDPFGGREDLGKKIIRAVGDPKARLSQDPLRMMRAARLVSVLEPGWKIEKATLEAVKENASLLRAISKERIREELMKIIMSDRAAEGIDLLRELGLLAYIIPELEESYGISQNKHHIYDCYEHSLFSLKYAAEQKFNKYVRLSALLHDIAKPRTKRGQGDSATFYNHEMAGAKMTVQIMERLKFPKKDIEKVAKLVRYHLFYYNVNEVTESSVRRLVRNVGPENMEELLQLRKCDRIGSGVPKAEPYKLRHLKYIIEKVSRDPISVKKLKVDGKDVMKKLEMEPGPKVGQILDVLLGHVLDDPKKNTKKFLEKEIERLAGLPDKKLEELAGRARMEREEIETKMDKMTKDKYWVT